MVWYYTIGIIKEEDQYVKRNPTGLRGHFKKPKASSGKIRNENMLEKSVQRLASPEAATPKGDFIQEQVPPATITVSRREIPASKRLEKIVELYQEKESVKSGYDKTKINKKIKVYKKTFTYLDRGLNRVYDLNNNLIGRIHSDRDSPSNLEIGNEECIRGFRFDFVWGFMKVNSEDESNVYVRTTAFLTCEGKKKAERYVIKRMRENSEYIPHSRPNTHYARFGKVHSKPKLDISKYKAKMRLGNTRTFDMSIKGQNAHINLDGKIEIFTFCPQMISSLLVNETSDIKYKANFQEYVHYTTLKRWISRTDKQANLFIGATFQNLADVLYEVLG